MSIYRTASVRMAHQYVCDDHCYLGETPGPDCDPRRYYCEGYEPRTQAEVDEHFRRLNSKRA